MNSPDYIKALYDVLDELDSWIDITGDSEVLQLFRTNLVLRIVSASTNPYNEVPVATEVPHTDPRQLLLELG
jgi:hypothetical protein